MKRKKNIQRGFTLLEMLAVLFIIGIIFSITLPTFGVMISTMQLTTATENLANTLESARQRAVTRGINCYVVFPETTNDPNMNYRAYKILEEPSTLNYVTVGKWEFLPRTVRIDSACTFISRPPGSDPQDPVPPPSSSITINFPEDNSAGRAALRCIQFRSNGASILNRTIRLTDINNSNLFQEAVFYNQPIAVNVRDVGKDKDD